LFEETKGLPWEIFIDENGKFPVSGKSVKSKLYSVPDCQAIVKKAIVERLKLKHVIASRMPETGSVYKLEIALHMHRATFAIDTYDKGLHKHGYQVEQGDAPL